MNAPSPAPRPSCRLGIALRRAVLLAGAGILMTTAAGSAQQIPNATAPQAAALARLTAELAQPTQALAAARTALVAAAFATPRDEASLRTRADAVRAAEQALATARANAFAGMQASASALAPEQVAALVAMGGALRTTGGGTAGGMPFLTQPQSAALGKMTSDLAQPAQAVTTARADLVAASLATPRNDADIRAKAETVRAAELALATARAEAFGALQASPDRLGPGHLSALVALGGSFRAGGFTEPSPMDFDDHEGYVSLFDGVSLKDWDGNPKFWRVEGGAIVGESTPQNPSGNSYLAYRGMEAKDFTLKFEIKIEGTGGSGLQYRSRTGLPWLASIPANVTANVGPVNLDWMMTGPQADFWPNTPVYTGQFYSENTPMRILAWRGQVVEGYGNASKRLMGTIGDRMALASVIKLNDWNQYTVIARGGTFIHILNGQLMAVMVDDDPSSSNNQSGHFGIEIEATTKVSVRNLWVKKLN